jgi:hypothetical protein
MLAATFVTSQTVQDWTPGFLAEKQLRSFQDFRSADRSALSATG